MATDEEVRASASKYMRRISGFARLCEAGGQCLRTSVAEEGQRVVECSTANQEAFSQAVVRRSRLPYSLVTQVPALKARSAMEPMAPKLHTKPALSTNQRVRLR